MAPRLGNPHSNQQHPLAGAILLYPRLSLLKPVPDMEPMYTEAVGQVTSPIVILEGERTPNR